MVPPLEKRERLSDPIVTASDQPLHYLLLRTACLRLRSARQPLEKWGVWHHPIKLLDGFWLGYQGWSRGALVNGSQMLFPWPWLYTIRVSAWTGSL